MGLATNAALPSPKVRELLLAASVGLGIRDRVIGSAPLAATTTSPGERVATNAALPSPKVQREPQLPASAASVELGLIRDRATGSALPVETTTSPDVRTATSVALPSHSEIVARDTNRIMLSG